MKNSFGREINTVFQLQGSCSQLHCGTVGYGSGYVFRSARENPGPLFDDAQSKIQIGPQIHVWLCVAFAKLTENRASCAGGLRWKKIAIGSEGRNSSLGNMLASHAKGRSFEPLYHS